MLGRQVKPQSSFNIRIDGYILFFDASEAPSSGVPRSIASQVDDGRSQPTKAVVYPTIPSELVGHTDNATGRTVNNHDMIFSTRYPTLLSISLIAPTPYRSVAAVCRAIHGTNNHWLCH